MTSKPRYQNLKDHIVSGIRDKVWDEHTKVPSENSLCQQFGVSRMTANRALRELTDDGVLYRIQGLGTFVSENRPVKSVLQIKDIAEEVVARGGRFHSRVLDHKEIEAPPHASRFLDLDGKAQVFYSLVLHFEDDEPIQLEERFINKSQVPNYLNVDLTRETANHYLKETTPLSDSKHIIEAIAASNTMAESLDIEVGAPCIQICRITWNGNTPATYSKLVHPGTRYSLAT